MFYEFEKFAAVGETKELLIRTLDFVMDINRIDIKGFFIDETGYLVFCQYIDETETKEKEYPYIQTSVSLTEHIYQYIDNLSEEAMEKMKCVPTGYEESYVICWELFIPTAHGEYEIESYEWYKNALAVRPKLIERGK